MKIFILTDSHFGHSKMMEYCDRPEGFEDLILKNLQVVNYDDLLIHLGDFCLGRDSAWHSRFMSEVASCQKVLVKGNHDMQSDSWYLRNGWDFVCEQFRNTYFTKNILFSHCPAPDCGYDINIHGHFHNNLPRLLRKEWAVEGEEGRNKHDLAALNDKSLLLALENEDYKPINLEEFIIKET